MKCIILIASVFCLLGSCKQVNKTTEPKQEEKEDELIPLTVGYMPYKNDPAISDIYGNTVPDTWYVPWEKFIDSGSQWDPQIKRYVDTFEIDMYSQELERFEEPVLYNYYLNKTIYRLAVVPGIMGEYISITIVQDSNRHYVKTKITNDRTKIGTNDSATISKKQYDKIASYINNDSIALTTGIPINKRDAMDATGYLLEIHTIRGYLCIASWDKNHSGYFENIINCFFDISKAWEKEQKQFNDIINQNKRKNHKS